MKIGLISIFKNESHILEEWIEHYLKEGVDTFFLADNGSTDNYDLKIKKYVDTGIVVLNINPEKYAQTQILNCFLDKTKEYDWIIIVDLDEFVYARNGFNTIKDYLFTLDENIYRIGIPWKMFGSSGHITQPENVLKHFTMRLNFNKEANDTERMINCKSIMRGNQMVRIGVHYSDVNAGGILITADNKETNTWSLCPVSEKILENSYLHLNHYAIQSWEFFSNVKMTRGDVIDSNKNGLRNKHYFDYYDHHDLCDTELQLKQY